MILVGILALLGVCAAIGTGVTLARGPRDKLPTLAAYDTRDPRL